MRVVCVYRGGEDYTRMVEEWITFFEKQTGKDVESMNPDTREGVQFCGAYGVMEYPTLLVLDGGGVVLASWKGEMMPRFDEVSYWA